MNKDVSISGNKSVSGVECERLLVDGSLSVEQNIQAHSINTSGTVVVKEDIIATEINVSGSLRVIGALQAEKVVVSGYIFTHGESKIQELIITGEAELTNLKATALYGPNGLVAKNLESEKLEILRDENS